MFRDRTARGMAWTFLAIAAAGGAAGFLLSPAAGALVLLCTAAMGTAFLLFTRARYRRIARLSQQIDQILHHADQLYISDEEEGELSILQSEIGKMTLRIREQNEALRREKAHLADSLADIAHQLRTPLTSANLLLPLLRRAGEEERGTLVREMEALLGQMDWLVTALLKLSRLDAGMVVFQREEVPVDRLIRRAARPLLMTMDLHSVTLTTHIPPGVTLTGDEGWLAEAIQNILKNAAESAGDRGWISVVCTDTPLFTEIAIRDSGPGFAPEELPRLFTRFYRGRRSGGFGIGLALCRTILTGQGGTVTAKNHPEGGALFTIRFPK